MKGIGKEIYPKDLPATDWGWIYLSTRDVRPIKACL